jgi:hypothetical protein
MAFRGGGNVVAAGDARMADNGHDKLTAAAAERAFEPCPLSRIDCTEDAGVDPPGVQNCWSATRKTVSAACQPHLIQVPEPCSPCQKLLDAVDIGGGEPEISLYATFDSSARRLGLEKICVEPLQCIKPVMISRNRIDRFGKALECEIEVGFVVLHSTRGIDHVGSNHQELHIFAVAELKITRDQCILGGITLSRIADDKEAEIARFCDAGGMDLKDLVAASKGPRNRVDHSDAPRIDSELRQLLINARQR